MAATSFDGTIVIGAGQSGLAVARLMASHGSECLVLEAAEGPGEAWRRRWDSLKLFTPAQHCGLPGLPFPARRGSFPARDDVAAYLTEYARDLPVDYGVKATAVRAADGGFEVETTHGTKTARSVVVATGANAVPYVPALAARLAPGTKQLHSSGYRNPGSVPDGGVLVVGAGTSGVEIAVELAATHPVWLAGQPPVHIPAPLLKYAGGLYWQFIHRVLTLRTPLGRKVAPKVVAHGAPLISVSMREAERAGVARLPRLAEVDDDGEPAFPGHPAPRVRTVIWATGFRPDFSWIEGLPVDGKGWPLTARGAVAAIPGLYFVGMPFQYGLTSALLGGAGRDARMVARSIAASPAHAAASALPAADG